MEATDIRILLPIIILAGGILFTLLLVAVKRNHLLTFICTSTTLAASLITLCCMTYEKSHSFGDLFLLDRFGLYYQGLILLSTLVVTIFSYISIRNFYPEKRKEEYYLVLMLGTLGAAMMVVSTHFISFFVSLEILTISLYTLISYYRERSKAIEAGLKYLILAAMSSAFLLFGMALIYSISGTMSFQGFAEISFPLTSMSSVIIVAGVGMMMVSIGFKLGLVPFHMWTPDIYEGASSPTSAFIATISKGAMLAVLLHFFIMADLYRFKSILLTFTIIAVLSMLIGNLLALRQNNIKRLLAYSSIAHFGYLLIAVIAGKEIGLPAATFYITVYIITMLGAFGLVTLISRSNEEAMDIEAYLGLFWRKPILATIFTVILLSLAGIPLTAGFMAKFFLLTAGVEESKWLLAFTLVVGSVIGLYYYLRVIVAMMKKDENTVPGASLSRISYYAGVLVLIILGVLVMELGTSPAWLIDVINGLP
ncbi:MAG: NADH-quinone oxidoreductase subunit N [Eubacteriaceae bacterium]|nr:NADH-quinone oxidoreductase subunit N [Eubacteriaceae bacterium]